MKGLIHLPGTEQLVEAYSELQNARAAASAKNLALWSQWARLDPRLAEQLVGHFHAFWQGIPPLELRDRVREQPWPATLGVLLTQTSETFRLATGRRIFRKWHDLVLEGIPPATGEQFFIGTRSFAGKLMREDAFFSLKSYRQWGYLGRDSLIAKNLGANQNRTLLSTETRRNALEDLLRTRARISVREYREALGQKVSLRTAEADLKKHPRLAAQGNTRGRFYRVRTRRISAK